MNKELMEALDILEKEKEISKETLFDAIENSLMTACKNHFGKADNIKVEIDRDTCDFLCYAEKEVVPTKEDVEDDCLQIALDDAKEISKKAGEEGFYLDTDRQYRTEEDVFEDFTAEERSKLFGEPPATVWENLCAFEKYPEKVAVLTQGNILKKEYIDSFMQGALIRWKTELLTRLIPENYQAVIDMKRLHNQETCTDCDLAMWRKIQNLRAKLAKDSFEEKSIFTAIRRAVAEGDYDTVSKLKVEMGATMEELKTLYHDYKQNIID